MANTNEMTRKDFYELIKSETSHDEVKAFCDHQIELLDKAKNRGGKPTAKQLENEKLKKALYEDMSALGTLMVAEIMTNCESVLGLSNQKITHLLTDLVKDNKVVRTVDRRIAYYTAITDDTAKVVETAEE